MRALQIIALTLLILVVAAGPASAQITNAKYLEFDQDGVLPSADPDITFQNMYAAGLEAPTFSVSGGVLTGNSMPSAGNYLRYDYDALASGPGLSYSEPWMLECRVRVLESNQLNVNSPIGTMTMYVANHRWIVTHTASTIRWHTGSSGFGEIAFDNTQWHTIRMQCPGGGMMKVYVDDVLVAPIVWGDSTAGNGFSIGLSDSYSGAHVEWDYVHMEAGPDAVAVDNATWGSVKSLYR